MSETRDFGDGVKGDSVRFKSNDLTGVKNSNSSSLSSLSKFLADIGDLAGE